MNSKRILAIATNVFREVIRDRVLYLAGLFIVLMVAAVLLLPEISAGTQDKIILDVGLAAIDQLGLIVAVFVGTGLVNREIEKRTALTLIAKPVNRVEFIVGKHTGLSAVLALLVMLTTAFYLVVLSVKGIQYSWISLFLVAFYLVLELSLITAAAILFSIFTSSLVATILTFATYLMGHLSQDLVALSNLTENTSIRRLVQGLYLILPDLSRLNLKNDAVYNVLPAPLVLLADASYGILYTVFLLAIATWIFSNREF